MNSRSLLRSGYQRDRAFTRVELLIVLLAIAALGMTVCPALARTRAPGQKAGCENNLRQLGLAALIYADDNAGLLPARTSTNRWPQRLLRFYGSTHVLRCPSDGPNPAAFGSDPARFPADSAPRSYLINGFNDFFSAQSPPGLLNNQAMPVASISQSGGTILFGEKATESGHVWMDYSLGDDLQDVEHARHKSATGDFYRGGSNYAMADGSVRFLRFGYSIYPTNLWAVLDAWRTNSFSP